MCGRFTLATTADQFNATYGLNVEDLPARYNIAPTQPITVVTSHGLQRSLETMRWGLIPGWAKDAQIGNHCINARSETVFSKPAFSKAIMRHRCLIPASGFYEWTDHGKHAWLISKDSGLLTMAGIWEVWNSPDGPIHSCAILTSHATPQVSQIHDRMPLFLDATAFDSWLHADPFTPEELQVLVEAGQIPLKITEVSTRVNNVHEDDEELVKPFVPEQGSLF